MKEMEKSRLLPLIAAPDSEDQKDLLSLHSEFFLKTCENKGKIENYLV